MKKKNTNYEPMSETDLSRFWYCPDDRTRLQPKTDRIAQNPYFRVTRENISNGVLNAASLRKIDNVDQGLVVANYMFDNSNFEEIELVGTICHTCQLRFSAPKLVRVLDLPGINTGRALYDAQKSLATKDYGRFRFVNHFGLGSNQNQGQGNQGRNSLRSLWFLGWFIGIGNLIAILVLYYIIGFEMKIGKKFYPLGPLVLIIILITILGSLVYFNLIEPLADALGSFRR